MTCGIPIPFETNVGLFLFVPLAVGEFDFLKAFSLVEPSCLFVDLKGPELEALRALEFCVVEEFFADAPPGFA